MRCHEMKKTTEVARELTLPVYTLLNWIRYGVISTPRNDSSGHYLWGGEDVAAARAAAQRRRPGETTVFV